LIAAPSTAVTVTIGSKLLVALNDDLAVRRGPHFADQVLLAGDRFRLFPGLGQPSRDVLLQCAPGDRGYIYPAAVHAAAGQPTAQQPGRSQTCSQRMHPASWCLLYVHIA
jgi:hypothetical protein